MKRLKWCVELARSESGNVLPMACVGILMLAALVGGGVDASRAYMVHNRLQNACDAGVLAGRRAVADRGYDNAAEQQANTYFAVNFDTAREGVSDTRFTTVGKEQGNRVEGEASTVLNTALMQLFGYKTLRLRADCVASMSVGNSDVVMVLDTTGSMRNRQAGDTQTRMQALQSAMKNFYDTVAAAKAGSNARVRFGFVPYSSSVNVGRLIYDLDPDYLVDSYNIQSRVPLWRTERTWFGTYTVFDRWEYRQVSNFNYAAYKTFSPVTTQTGNNGTNQTSTWQGCIEERKTVAGSSFSFSPLTGMSPSGAFDLDIDGAPGTSNDTKWAPMWQGVAYDRSSSSSGTLVNSYCPQAGRLLAEMSRSQFYTYADSLFADGSTYHDIGMIWGARLSSPTGIFAANVTQRPPNGGAVARHVIFMSDGKMEPSTSVQSTYGIERLDRRVTSNGSSNQAARHTSRFLAVCEATKAKGIRVWVIAFADAVGSDLERCASDDSSFTASNAAQLNRAFQDIAKEVGELRIVE